MLVVSQTVIHFWYLIKQDPGDFFSAVTVIILAKMVINLLVRAKKMQSPLNYTPIDLTKDRINMDELAIAGLFFGICGEIFSVKSFVWLSLIWPFIVSAIFGLIIYTAFIELLRLKQELKNLHAKKSENSELKEG
jgi:hypothetical protein